MTLNTIGKKITLIYLVTFLTFFIPSFILIYLKIQKTDVEHTKQILLSEAYLVEQILKQEHFDFTNREHLQSVVSDLDQKAHIRITLVDASGLVLADSRRSAEELLRMDNHRNRPEIKAALKGKLSFSLRRSDTIKINMLYAALPLQNEAGETIAVLRLALPASTISPVFLSTKSPLVVFAAVGIFSMFLVSFLLGKSISQSVLKMTKAAIKFSKGEFSEKLEIGGEDELQILAKALNQMALLLKNRIIQIEKERLQFSGVVENMSEGVIAVDVDNRILMINRSAERILGMNKTQAFNKSLFQITRDERIEHLMEQAMSQRTILTEEIEHFNGEIRMLRINAIGIQEAKDEISGLVVLYDVTELRKLETMRRDFVANVSHELKTPLTSIKGFIETLLGGALQKDVKSSESFLRMMEEDTDRLSRLIDDLLDLSKIESKTVQLKKIELNLKQETNQVIKGFQKRMDERNIQVKNLIPDIKIKVDRDQLKQVLTNLIDNAVKFSKDNGEIICSSETNLTHVKLSVEDRGIGIPKDSIPRIFERFYRVDKARSRALGGTGLGLSIVKHIVELHGGEVFCESKIGSGSKFSFTIPL